MFTLSVDRYRALVDQTSISNVYFCEVDPSPITHQSSVGTILNQADRVKKCAMIGVGNHDNWGGQNQAAISWCASGDRQISLSASEERAFANFRDNKHCFLQLQIFATKTYAGVGSAALALTALR